jgi:hypothetical protein
MANAVGAAMTNHRVLGPAESRVLVVSGVALLAITALAVVWPAALAFPLAVLTMWIGASLLWRAIRLGTRRKIADKQPPALLPSLPLPVEPDTSPDARVLVPEPIERRAEKQQL